MSLVRFVLVLGNSNDDPRVLFPTTTLQIIVADTGNNRLQLFYVDCIPGMVKEMRADDIGRYMDTHTTANWQEDRCSARSTASHNVRKSMSAEIGRVMDSIAKGLNTGKNLGWAYWSPSR